MLLRLLMTMIGYVITGSFRQRLAMAVALTVLIASHSVIAMAMVVHYHLPVWPVLESWIFAVTGLAWLFTWCWAGYIIKPLLILGEAVNKVRLGQEIFALPSLSGRDEVAKLATVLTEMVSSWQRQQQELENFNLVLEDLVANRTSELDYLNKKLAQEIGEREKTELALQKVNQELQQLTLQDSLTGIANRRCFDDCLSQEWKRASRTKQYVSLLLLDVDYFKPYNDFYGHPAGDKCLKEVAKALLKAVRRPSDVVARYGGEEFAIILPDTDLEGAKQVALTISEQVQALNIPHLHSEYKQVTVSIGVVATIPDHASSIQRLVRYADQLLYQAKHNGRNRMEAALLPPLQTYTPVT